MNNLKKELSKLENNNLYLGGSEDYKKDIDIFSTMFTQNRLSKRTGCWYPQNFEALKELLIIADQINKE